MVYVEKYFMNSLVEISTINEKYLGTSMILNSTISYWFNKKWVENSSFLSRFLEVFWRLIDRSCFSLFIAIDKNLDCINAGI